MDCRYCRAQNAEDDHRCQRCGRRLRTTPVYTGSSAAAPELFSDAAAWQSPQIAAVPKLTEAEPSVRRTGTYQRPLFNSREVPEVIPFESIAPHRTADIRDDSSSPSSRPRAHRPIPGQQSLEFATPSGAQASSQPLMFSGASVASAAHRLVAAGFDAAVVGVASVLFFVVIRVGGVDLEITKPTVLFLAVITIVFGLLYHVLWALANAETAGMTWARLRIVDFDGHTPDREQRLYRLASSCISIMSAGLGVLWSLLDEDSLTWHDHMSKTFPTSY